MQDKIKEVICVDGNRYFTPYGFYTCRVTASESKGNKIKVKVTLLSESDGLQPARVYRVTGTLKAIERERLNLIIDIHKWALLDRDHEHYWVNKVEL